MTVLVTGGVGYVGSFVSRELLRLGHDVVIVDDLSEGFLESKPAKASFFKGSILDQNLISEIIRTNRIDAIVHMAAKTKVQESVTDPLTYYRVNNAGTLELFKTAMDLGVRQFIFSSTAAVYGNHDVELVDEKLSCLPENPYGRSKLFAEQGIRDIAKSNPQMSVVCLRYFNIAGAAEDGSLGPLTRNATTLIKVVAETAAGRRPFLTVFGDDYPTPDGTCIRDFIHVEDIASAHANVLGWSKTRSGFEVMNVGYGHGFSVREVISVMEKVSGRRLDIRVSPRRPGDAVKVLANAARIRELTGWQPQKANLESICRSAYEWELKISHPSKG
jgi:UDP-glucose 4-epimerase